MRKLPKAEFTTFHDLLFWTGGKASQIDHVVVSQYGIFVIETKNFSGWIHGTERSEYWTQTIYSSRSQFRNPIKQNWAHIYALKEVLSGLQQPAFYPIVVFTGSGELKNVRSTSPVIYDQDLLRTIDEQCIAPKVNPEAVTSIVQRLSENRVTDKLRAREQVFYARRQASRRRSAEREHRCPKCGGYLVWRDGRYGAFYGCSNYPACRYTLNQSRVHR